MESTDLIATATQYVNSTQEHIFLTGKAGTGKTTFLRNLAQHTHKRFTIVAPTGIAALNAGGVTIHSQFLLPLGTFLPIDQQPDQLVETVLPSFTRKTLAYKHPLSSEKKKVLREIDLLIIDEVSMLRADVLDAIDYRLRSTRANYNLPFGGVQVLFIGDLFQLPPVVKDHEKQLLHSYYSSAFFFNAHALQHVNLVHIELQKIFRQQDQAFVQILNHVRNNEITSADVAVLNSYYQAEGADNAITLTTHNKQADSINQKALDELSDKSIEYKADITDEFPENIYPVDDTLSLKVGARIMFTKNDTKANRYYNGKMATVLSLSKSKITVAIDDDAEPYELERYTWDNKKYEVSADTKELEEEVIGSFRQYPVKLAWAITIHKSQGLTFDKACVDIGRAFAAGQVYVALSRLRSLDGLVLKQPIDGSSIANDAQVVDFSATTQSAEKLLHDLPQLQADYLQVLLQQTFSLEHLVQQTNYLLKKHQFGQFESDHIQRALPELRQLCQQERTNLVTFQAQLIRLSNERDEQFLERLQKGSGYYQRLIWNSIKSCTRMRLELEAYSKTKAMVKAIEELEQLLINTYHDLQKIEPLAKAITLQNPVPEKLNSKTQLVKLHRELIAELRLQVDVDSKKAALKTGRKKKVKTGADVVASETYQKTLAMINDGLTPEEIADQRGMAEGTIYGHLSKLIGAGEIDISKLMSPDQLDKVMHAMDEISFKSLSELKVALDDQYTYDVLRLVLAHRARRLRLEDNA